MMKQHYLLTLIVLLMATTSFSQTTPTFVLVHAQWHGKWSWDKLAPLLTSKGYRVITFDMPGHGDDTAAAENITLEDCVQKVVSIVTGQQGPVILVAHSSGGVVMAQASEILGKDKVASLVFLDAFMPNNGESVFSLAEKFAPEGTPLGKTLILSQDHKTISLNFEKIGELLYHDCSPADLANTKTRLRPGPVAMLATPARLSQQNYGAIPKFYILCTEAKDMDKSTLSGNVPCEEVFKIASSHSPFFSMPGKLAEILTSIANNKVLQVQPN